MFGLSGGPSLKTSMIREHFQKSLSVDTVQMQVKPLSDG